MQMHQIAVQVTQDLHFDMAGATDQLLEVHLVVAEGGFRFAPRRFERGGEIALALDHPHAAPATAPACLQHQRVTDLGRDLRAGRGLARQRRTGRHDRDLGRHRRMACGDLVAERAHHLRRWADPAQPGLDHAVGELGVLRQKAIARMDRIDLGRLRDPQDILAVEIRFERLPSFADQVAFVGLESMQCLLVLLGIDADRADPHFGSGAHHADRDLRAIGDEDRANGLMLH